jgi:hypothetical protein
MIIGKAKFVVEYTSLENGEKIILSTIVEFEDRGDSISYLHSLRDSSNKLIGGKGRSIYKKNIDSTNPLEFAIKHAVYSIDNFLVNRKRVFKVIEMHIC